MDGGEKVLVKEENIDFQAPSAIAATRNSPVPGQPIGGPVVGTVVGGTPTAADAKQPTTLAVAPPPADAIAKWMQGVLGCFCIPVAERPAVQ